jgi:tetratricopeptide (TPR) repeat protein
VRTLAIAALLLSCKPSATVENTMPVANLQSYRSIALRAHTNAFASQGQAMMLEGSLTQRLRQKCGFEAVGPINSTANPDVVLDLNITKVGRNTGGTFSNTNQAVVDVLVVLTDGRDKELLGTATIHGKSSGMIINNNNPETQAIEVVADTIATLLTKSGCSGPRIARIDPPPPDSGSNGPIPNTGSNSANVPPPIDDATKQKAEALNEAGKEKLYGADLAGALALFQQAMGLVPDPRYEFNVCLTFGAQEQWDNAIAACRQARSMNPNEQLAQKIDRRLESLQKRQ